MAGANKSSLESGELDLTGLIEGMIVSFDFSEKYARHLVSRNVVEHPAKLERLPAGGNLRLFAITFSNIDHDLTNKNPRSIKT